MWPDKERVVELFEMLATQWRTSPMGGQIGLDYVAMNVVATAYNIPVTAELINDVRIMEYAAIISMKDREKA